MRRVFGLILLGLGVFAAAVAILLPNYVYPKVAKVPLDQNSTSVLEGPAGTVLAVTKKDGVPTPEIRKDTQLTAVAKVQANFSVPEMRPDTDVAVWLLAVKVTDDKDNTVVNASKRQVCFDRRTAEGYRGQQDAGRCSPSSTFTAEVDTTKEIKEGKDPEEKIDEGPQPGLQFKFPFGTEKKDYSVYQDTVNKAMTAKFISTDEVNGVDVYKFEQDVPDTQIAEQDVPGSLINEPANTVHVQQYFKGTSTMWVEPVTGVIVKQQQYQHQELRKPGELVGTTVFDGTLTFNNATIESLVKQAGENKGKLELLTSTGPISLGVGGGLMILIGALLVLRGRRAKQSPPDDQTAPQHALAR
ncbi:DUF3068 domain-containing protein [Actinocrispum sp. NPDC049592]|uniref:DUF3068 domain-containing protein n=1 Tax=Actinocrispum sp. NPDC049592 TaxID=3154835 RepID=UPI00341556E1